MIVSNIKKMAAVHTQCIWHNFRITAFLLYVIAEFFFSVESPKVAQTAVLKVV